MVISYIDTVCKRSNTSFVLSATAHEPINQNQIKSNLFVTQNTNTNERSKTKSNVPTGHKGSKELY